MSKYTSVDGASFNEEDIESWALKAEKGLFGGGHLTESLPGPPRAAKEVRDYQRPISLDLGIVVTAQEHYLSKGFENVPVPWVITEETYMATLPEGVRKYSTLGGFLVGSAEQSFIQLLLNGDKLGRVQAVSPCFRDEDHDEIHSPYFFKLELFDNELPQNRKGVFNLIDAAQEFFERYLPVTVTKEGENSWDIVARHNSLELGSYGIRRFRKHSWIYGTGVALPRLNQALASLP